VFAERKPGGGFDKAAMMASIKSFGVAGTLAYIVTELIFWGIALPGGALYCLLASNDGKGGKGSRALAAHERELRHLSVASGRFFSLELTTAWLGSRRSIFWLPQHHGCVAQRADGRRTDCWSGSDVRDGGALPRPRTHGRGARVDALVRQVPGQAVSVEGRGRQELIAARGIWINDGLPIRLLFICRKGIRAFPATQLLVPFG
jgi:hypothetical protein